MHVLKRFLVVTMLLSSVVLSGCATQGTLPMQLTIDKSRTYDAPFDAVWSAIIRGAAESNLRVSTIEKVSGLIAFSDASYSPSQAIEGTRGSVLGTPDQIMNRVGSLNIFAINSSPEKTTVRVNTNFKMYIRSGNGSQAFPYSYHWEESYSNGKVEQQILESVAARVK